MNAEKKPTVLGTGLIALDIVVNGDTSKPHMYSTGGTCGNVLVNLAYLGWNSYPVGRLARDWAGRYIQNQLREFKVNCDFLRIPPVATTPMIIHRIRKSLQGQVSHSFSWTCPHCGMRLPSYRAVTQQSLKSHRIRSFVPSVFFFDRPSAGAIDLAEKAKASGALIVFEYAGTGNDSQLSQAFEIAHVVKYSEERGPQVPKLKKLAPFLEVQTLGSKGLRFRYNSKSWSQNSWQLVDSFHVQNLKDAAGAGDWCTAGLIDFLGKSGISGFTEFNSNELANAFKYAQALSAINCSYEGARGVMDALSADELKAAAKKLVNHRDFQLRAQSPKEVQKSSTKACPLCRTE